MAVLVPPSPDTAITRTPRHARTGSAVVRRWVSFTVGKQREARSAHNAELPIARLPGEVLAEIFTWHIVDVCTTTEDHSYDSLRAAKRQAVDLPRYRPAPYSWLYIRHICRAWRQIALTYQELSTHICLSIPSCVKELLGRSGALPLHVYDPSPHYMGTHERRVRKCYELILRHASRILRGTLLAPNGAIEFMPPGAGCDVGPGTLLDVTALLRPPSHLFTIRPFLHLPMASTGQVEASPASSTLQALHVRRFKLIGHSLYDRVPEDFAEELRHFRNLEELVLGDVVGGDIPSWTHFTHQDIPAIHGEQGITLPRLRSIRLTARSAGAGLYFLSRIDHPPSTALDIAFTDLKPPLHSDCHCIESMICWTIRGLTCNDTTPIQSLHLSVCHDRRGLDLRLWKAYQPLAALRTPSRAAQPSLRFSLKACSNTAPAFTSLVQRLPLDSVRSAVLVDRAAGEEVVGWEALLSALPALEELALDYHVLASPGAPHHTLEPRDAHALCPALRTLDVLETAGAAAYESQCVKAGLCPAVTLAHVGRGLVARGVPGAGMRVGAAAVDYVREVDFGDSDAESFVGVCVDGPSGNVYTSQWLPGTPAPATQQASGSSIGRFMSRRGRHGP
ncbi:hypothetical protein PsYK624_053360 [Phanerochaete sordida]|uniref:F-box domain-containing protein n=1 Tax=Phanerochaete sordida TaxID=48140 RepID=A0A9P3G7H9_9APHY|nr:hypothetical protein PsYK624_053360 [Phanerochaete sordida]